MVQSIGGYIALYLGCALAAAAGSGGGAFNVTILLKFFGYEYDEAVVLSLCTVLGNSMSQVIVNLNKRHPLDPRRPLIYWDMAMLILPAQLCGNSIGSILSKILPTTALMILAVFVTLFALYMTYRKACHVYEQESEDLAAKEAASSRAAENTASADAPSGEGAQQQRTGDFTLASQLGSKDNSKVRRDVEAALPLPSEGSNGEASHLALTVGAVDVELGRGDPPASRPLDITAQPQPQQQSLAISANADEEANQQQLHLPYPMMGGILVTLGFFLTIKSLMSEVLTLCTVSYWATFAVSFPVMAALIGFAVQTIASQQRSHPESVLKGDLTLVKHEESAAADNNSRSSNLLSLSSIYSVISMLSCSAVSFTIGVVSRLLGIGGGELFGPYLLHLKVLPQVSTGTTSILSFVSSLYNIVTRVISNEISYGPAVGFCLVGMAGGVTGRLSALRLAKVLKRPSVLIYIIILFLTVSIAILIEEIADSEPEFGTKDYCP